MRLPNNLETEAAKKDNLEKLVQALGLLRGGTKIVLMRRIEAELRKRGFQHVTDWVPTTTDVNLATPRGYPQRPIIEVVAERSEVLRLHAPRAS